MTIPAEIGCRESTRKMAVRAVKTGSQTEQRKMRAIILAAGSGKRLSPLTDKLPKCLVPIGGESLLERQVEALLHVGVTDIVVVVGYKREQVRAFFGNRVRYVYNPDYLTTNSIYSLYLARAEMEATTFLLNCDILFHVAILRRMLETDSPNVLAVDSGRVPETGEMNVVIAEGSRVDAIGKTLDPHSCQAQSVQLVKFDADGAAAVGSEVERLISRNNTDVFPTSAYGPLINNGRLMAVDVWDLPWTEVDSLEDHRRAEDYVLSCIEEDG